VTSETEERKTVSKTAIVASGTIQIVFAVSGTELLSIFGITILSYMIAGGVLLFSDRTAPWAWRFGGGILQSGED
jgi:multiple antibiotic resistance protein